MFSHPGTADLPARFVNVDRARAQHGDRVDRLGTHLMRGDPLADDVVNDLRALGEAGWAMFERALAHGIGAVPEAPSSMRALFSQLDHVPTWVDWRDVDRGGELLLRAGVLGGVVLGARSLVVGYMSPAGNKPLVLSGRLEQQAARRLNETARFVQASCAHGGLRRFADGFAITVKVRLMHAQVRRMILGSGTWDSQRYGLPINQHDMLGTSLLFSLVVVDGLRMLGFDFGEDELARYFALWRYSGWIIGVDPELLPATEREARSFAELILATQGPPDDDSRALTRALMTSAQRAAKTPEERARAARETRIGHGFCRALLGDEMADALEIPRDPLRHAVPVLRAVVARMERVRKTVPALERHAVTVGEAYWKRVVEIGLGGASAEFRLPERLGLA